MQIARLIDQHAWLVCHIQDNNILLTLLEALSENTPAPTILTVFMDGTKHGDCGGT